MTATSSKGPSASCHEGSLDDSRRPLLPPKKDFKDEGGRWRWSGWMLNGVVVVFLLVLFIVASIVVYYSGVDSMWPSSSLTWVDKRTLTSNEDHRERSFNDTLAAPFAPFSPFASTPSASSINSTQTLVDATTNSTGCFRFACILAIPAGAVLGILVGVPCCVSCVYCGIFLVFCVGRAKEGGAKMKERVKRKEKKEEEEEQEDDEDEQRLRRSPSLLRMMRLSCGGGRRRDFCCAFWTFGFFWGALMGVVAWLGCALFCEKGLLESLELEALD